MAARISLHPVRMMRSRGRADQLLAAEADTEYYVQRLIALYCQQFAQAFRREDFVRIFRIPAGDGPFEESDPTLAEIHTIATTVSG